MKDRVAFVHRSLVAGLSLLAAVLLGSRAQAADHDIIGQKLLLKGSPKMVFQSKDPAVAAGTNGSSADPRCVPDGGGLGGSVKLFDGTNNVTVNMPCANWTTNGPGTLYKYKDESGVPKVGKIKAGLLKVVSLGMGDFPVPNGPATVDVEVSVGSDKYCMTFSGTGDGSKFLVKKNVTPGICGVCGNDVQEGTEECDGAASAACPGNCLGDCTCAVCGNDIQEGTEECDGAASAACPGNCLGDCTCAAVCGNHVREGAEECDGPDASACIGPCLGDCTCAVLPECPIDGATGTVCHNLGFSNCGTCCGEFGCDGCTEALLAGCSDATLNDTCAQSIDGGPCSYWCCQ